MQSQDGKSKPQNIDRIEISFPIENKKRTRIEGLNSFPWAQPHGESLRVRIHPDWSPRRDPRTSPLTEHQEQTRRWETSFYIFIHGSKPVIYSDSVNLSHLNSYRLETWSRLRVNPSPSLASSSRWAVMCVMFSSIRLPRKKSDWLRSVHHGVCRHQVLLPCLEKCRMIPCK